MSLDLKKLSKAVSAFALVESKENPRFSRDNLKLVYQAGPYTVATDGHRLLCTQMIPPCPAGLRERWLDPGALAKEKIAAVDGDGFEYADWKRVIPKGTPKGYFTLTVPEWCPKRESPGFNLALLPSGLLSWGDPQPKGAEALICFNLALLAPFAGEEVCCTVYDQHSPMVVAPRAVTGYPLDEIELAWFALIMPRGGAGIVSQWTEYVAAPKPVLVPDPEPVISVSSPTPATEPTAIVAPLPPKPIPSTVSGIAWEIRREWPKPYFGAVPYLNAMQSLETVEDSCGSDNGRSVVSYFLANASTFRGSRARELKAALKAMCA